MLYVAIRGDVAREVQEFSSCLLFIVSHVQVKEASTARGKDSSFWYGSDRRSD